ncbi:MAG: hypothetical protein FWC70_01615 [Defluviitaleaceae bacterium]|nr:hypothetical protein [Defluviitaleaceae bacterium]
MITLPAFFDDGMVLAKNARVWGWASPNEIVSAEFSGNEYEATADENGKFIFQFDSENFGGPFTLRIGEINIRDVYVGRVWFCGGQSNMEGPLSRSRVKFGEFIEDDERIRIFQVEKGLNFIEPQKNAVGKWNAACGEFLNHMYAVPYFFARKLLSHLNDDVKIGLVCAPAGGTPIEGWLPEEIIREKFPHYMEALAEVKQPGFIERQTEDAETAKQAWVLELNENDEGLKKRWFDKNYDDSEWERRPLSDNTADYGAVWFRKIFFAGRNEHSENSVLLNFGRAQDSVTVYINGVEIMYVPYQYPPCTCVLPKNLLVSGENVITVRVVGETQRPLMIPGKEYYLDTPAGRIPLDEGEWSYRVGATMPACPPGVWFYSRACGLYNHMLAPLTGLSIEGALWYQGESNTYAPERYEPMFTEFIKFFREKFTDLPFIFTQLANYIDPNGDGENWAALREQQRKCLKIPNTAMAVTIDCGEYNDLHPTDKKTVGERLALHALRMVYGKNAAADGPTVSSVTQANGEVTIFFRNASGLWSKNGRPQLELIDEHGNIETVFARIHENTLVVRSEKIFEKIRFGYTDCPAVTLYNAAYLPASPFEIEGN